MEQLKGLPRKDEECDQPGLPGPFIDGLRAAVESGLTEKQVIAVLNLAVLCQSLLSRFDPSELVQRSVPLLRVMQREVDRKNKERGR